MFDHQLASCLSAIQFKPIYAASNLARSRVVIRKGTPHELGPSRCQYDRSLAMSSPVARSNRRILIIDDTPSIHEDFRKTLCPEDVEDHLQAAEQALFGDVISRQVEHFELHSAFQGQEGLTKVEQALLQGQPYAMAFIDMRMPPGWDGLETIERLWQVDPKLQVALCTAYSDYSWEDIDERLELGDRLLILKKPFD